MCSIADTGYNGYLCIAHTQYCTYLHRSSIADTGYCIADTGYTHALKNIYTSRARAREHAIHNGLAVALPRLNCSPHQVCLLVRLRSLTATNMWQPAQAAIPR